MPLCFTCVKWDVRQSFTSCHHAGASKAWHVLPVARVDGINEKRMLPLKITKCYDLRESRFNLRSNRKQRKATFHIFDNYLQKSINVPELHSNVRTKVYFFVLCSLLSPVTSGRQGCGPSDTSLSPGYIIPCRQRPPRSCCPCPKCEVQAFLVWQTQIHIPTFCCRSVVPSK